MIPLDLAKQLGVSIKVAAGPHERLAGLHDDSVFAVSPFLQFTEAIAVLTSPRSRYTANALKT